jgi:hypothetical protein
MWRGARSAAVWATLALACGCGARTTLSTQEDRDASVVLPPLDAGPDAGPDAGRDAGPPPDAGRDAAPPDAGPVVPCERDADCATGVCRARPAFAPVDLAPVPLACGAPDPGAAVGAPCGARGECDRGLCAVAGVCLRPCARDADCGSGERCREVLVRTAEAALQPLRACTALVAAPDDVRVAGPEPGPRLPGGMGATATDELPGLGPNALVVWAGGPGAVPFLARIRTRTTPPELLFDVFDADPAGPAPDWGVGPTTVGDAATLLFPNGPNTPPSPTGFTVELGSAAASDTERLLVQRSELGATLDLDVYLVGGGGWTSPAGGLPRPLSRELADVRRILAAVGLRVGEVRVHEVVGMTRRRFEILEGESGPLGVPDDLDDLFRLTAGANRPAMHVFFVRAIEGALGIAAGIPGPHVLPGTGASGVAVAVDAHPPGELATTIAHEIGHFMGLFHTSELDGSVNEPLTDTPECRSDRDADGDGFLLPSECRGAGTENLMFWAGVGEQLSDQQAEPMRRAYFVR